MISVLANPHRFMAVSGPFALAFALGGLVLVAAGLYDGLVISPPEHDQGDTVRIMYVHVPAAWLAMFGYTGMGVASFVYLVWRHSLADVAARAIAPVGAAFAFVCLATGAIWGRPTWGVWWVWDGRLASMLILFLLYLGYIALREALDDQHQGARAGAILALVGLVNVPVVKFSVDWWATAHQPAAVFRFDGPTLEAAFLRPLLVSALGFGFVFGAVVLVRMRSEVLRRRAVALERALEEAPA